MRNVNELLTQLQTEHSKNSSHEECSCEYISHQQQVVTELQGHMTLPPPLDLQKFKLQQTSNETLKSFIGNQLVEWEGSCILRVMPRVICFPINFR